MCIYFLSRWKKDVNIGCRTQSNLVKDTFSASFCPFSTGLKQKDQVNIITQCPNIDFKRKTTLSRRIQSSSSFLKQIPICKGSKRLCDHGLSTRIKRPRNRMTDFRPKIVLVSFNRGNSAAQDSCIQPCSHWPFLENI